MNEQTTETIELPLARHEAMVLLRAIADANDAYARSDEGCRTEAIREKEREYQKNNPNARRELTPLGETTPRNWIAERLMRKIIERWPELTPTLGAGGRTP